MLKEVQGRTTDFVVARDGTVMHGLALIYILRDLPQVAGFKIMQESLDLTRVQVVPGPGFDADTTRQVSLTADGAQLLERVRPLLSEAEDVEQMFGKGEGG